MTIDEAIEKERQKANESRKAANSAITFEGERSCIKCAEEHEQLVEWLEELKFRRNLLLECQKEFFEGYEKGKNDGYNKAIDDFVNDCKEDISCQTFGLHINGIERIAERLKARLKDE